MNFCKKKLMALAIAASCAPAFAITVGGIEVGASGTPHFQASEVYEDFVSTYIVNPGATTLGSGATPSIAPGAQIAGVGRVNSINGNTNFCVGGPGTCELTFRFFGYTAKAGATPSTIDFTNGEVDFYVGTGATLNFNAFGAPSAAALLASAVDGTPWLSVTGSTFLDLISGRTGTLQATGTNFGTGAIDAGTGIGQLNIISGLADVVAALNTNSVTNNLGCTPGVNCSDFDLTTSFSRVGAPPSGIAPLAGVTSVAGLVALAVPEPATLAVMAFGLLGIGMTGRRRRPD